MILSTSSSGSGLDECVNSGKEVGVSHCGNSRAFPSAYISTLVYYLVFSGLMDQRVNLLKDKYIRISTRGTCLKY